ncbi:PREDICTED: uncharacterized protein LOC109213261 [Nicotiana attenuata]|uniref:BZIP domain-containing protein n=1 Tax=Nicotiana attenuata TaxID=49451 RepID=A0A1J6L2H0_NICAT|nr:PREDICTED: uncharacterized protein LOC109213261 [Nicotiana attenuata]OIT27951.1 hypothetical protein A4A49_36058 [Nicotiana attenuata]
MNNEEIHKTTPSAADGRFSDDELVECEWEAAEVLACLSHPVTGDVQLCMDTRDAAGLYSTQKAYPPVSSGKSRQDLTDQAEKEGRRLRRVFANRESARQTIRRRQAMQEELTRKAADLALENENLKKNKELAAAEYSSLRNKNNSLKTQMAKIVKAEVQETDDESKLTPVETPSTSTTFPTFLHNQTRATPFFWSFQPLDGLPLQSGSHSISGITRQLPTPLGEFKPSDKLESPTMMNKPETPLYILPFPSPMPFLAQSNLFYPPSSDHNDQHETSVVHECSTSTPRTTVNTENHLTATPPKVETETTDSIDTLHRDILREADSGYLLNEGALRSKGLVQVTSNSSAFVRPVIARQSDCCQQDNSPDVKVASSARGHVAGASPKMYQQPFSCSDSASTDAIIAAKARRKRKELMKLKSQCYYHQFH